jgi:hypothetical protein
VFEQSAGIGQDCEEKPDWVDIGLPCQFALKTSLSQIPNYAFGSSLGIRIPHTSAEPKTSKPRWTINDY